MGLLDEIEAVGQAIFDPAIEVISEVVGGGSKVLPGVLPKSEKVQEFIEDILPIPGVSSGNGLTARIGGAACPVDTTGFGGGNGKESTRTIVETMDLRTGKIVRRKILAGSPHLMNKDIAAARKVFRATSKLHARMPRRTVRESKTKQLTDAAVDKALRSVNCDDGKSC